MAKPSEILVSKFPFTPTEDQLTFFKAAEQFITSSQPHATLLLKGYAGTGKTSILSSLVKVLPTFGFKSMLLAPTGRAAKVMARYTRKSAFTIHKVIYKLGDSDAGEARFMLQKNYHRNTVFIVDEASMIQDQSFQGSGLLADLIKFVFEHPKNKLLLVGDDAQLPPVGSSISPALDPDKLANTYNLKVQQVQLRQVMRQALDSGILENASSLREDIFKQRFQPQFNTAKPDIFKMTGERMEDGLRYAYDKYGVSETVVVCRSNKNAVEYNRHIRHGMFFHENEIECGDLIMIVKNNYHYKPQKSAMGFLANGDFAEVLKIRKFEDLYDLRFADLEIRLVDDPNEVVLEVKVILDTLHSNYPALEDSQYQNLHQQVRQDYQDVHNKADLRAALKKDPYLQALQIKFAYALTCHKAQGGQWDAVFLDQGYYPETQLTMDQMRWLYTGVTRASKELFLVNFDAQYFRS